MYVIHMYNLAFLFLSTNLGEHTPKKTEFTNKND